MDVMDITAEQLRKEKHAATKVTSLHATRPHKIAKFPTIRGINMKTDKRITFELPMVPHSLRAFIEKTVKDERSMFSFFENPVIALRAAGVPIDEGCLRKSDCDRLVRVLGKMRRLVADNKLAKDFRFEDVFTIGADVTTETTDTHSDTYINRHFTPDTDSETHAETTEGMHTNFKPFGFGRILEESGIIAPLLSAGDLAEIATRMDLAVKTLQQGAK